MGVFEKVKKFNKKLKNIRFCQFIFTKLFIFQRRQIVKNYQKFFKDSIKLQNFLRNLQNYLF